MTTSPQHPPHDGPAPAGTARPTFRSLLPTAAVAGVVAAVATTVLAAAAAAADVALEVDGTAVPVGAFPWWTVVGAVLGLVLARVLRDRRRFVAVTVVATLLSLVPAIALPDDTGTRLVLVAAHLLAAAIIVPALARKLPADRR